MIAMCVVYAEPYFLEPTLEALNGNFDTVYFAVPFKAFNGEIHKDENKKVLEILNYFCNKNKNWKIFNQDFESQADGYNFMLEKAKNISSDVLIFDSDEIWVKNEIDNLKHFVNKFPQYDVYYGHMHTYFKSLKWRITPHQNLKPVIAIKSHVKITSVRNPDSSNKIIVPSKLVCYHHPSHVRSDTVMKRKIDNCSERDRMQNWYENVWLKWTPDMKNFHPTLPKSFASVRFVQKDELPIQLLKYYERETI